MQFFNGISHRLGKRPESWKWRYQAEMELLDFKVDF